MENQLHSINNLFAQLGLPSSSAEIQTFIQEHRSLDAKTELCAAPFWSKSQAIFLREQIINDADWASVVDQLNNSLRK